VKNQLLPLALPTSESERPAESSRFPIRYHTPALRLMLVREAPGAFRQRPVIRDASAAAAVVQDALGRLAQERFVVLLLDVKNRLLGVVNVSEGDRASCVADPKIIFAAALLAGATRFLALHNHPSGDATPSPEDRKLTRHLAEAGRIMAIPLIDHIVIAGSEYVSLNDLDPTLFR
jgi:DNA repair protein RadC